MILGIFIIRVRVNREGDAALGVNWSLRFYNELSGFESKKCIPNDDCGEFHYLPFTHTMCGASSILYHTPETLEFRET